MAQHVYKLVRRHYIDSEWVIRDEGYYSSLRAVSNAILTEHRELRTETLDGDGHKIENATPRGYINRQMTHWNQCVVHAEPEGGAMMSWEIIRIEVLN